MRGYCIAVYLRVSSDDGNAGESDSISNQRGLLLDYIQTTGEFKDFSVEEFADDGYSGKNFDRPSIKRLLDEVAAGKINCILVKDFSRFGRNHLESGKYLETIFPFYNVRFISVNDGFDSKNQPYGTSGMEVALRNLIHETYIRDISNKIRSVQRHKMKKGEYLCAIAPFGYIRSATEKNKLAIDPEAADTVRYIFKLACEGNSPTMIANKMNEEKILTPLMYRKKNNTHGQRGWSSTNETNIWTDAIIRRILQDRRYTGDMVGHRAEKSDVLDNRTVQIPESERIVVPNTHEAIVSKEIFQAGKSVIKKIKKSGYFPPVKTLFSQILLCGHCNHLLIYERVKYPYYKCKFDLFMPECRLKLDEVMLKKAILNILVKEFSTCNNAETGTTTVSNDNIAEEIAQLDNLLIRHKSALDSCITDYTKGSISKEVFIVQRKEIHNVITHLENRKNELSEFLSTIQHDDSKTISLSPGVKLTREMIDKFIEVIYAFGDNMIEIIWKHKTNGNTSKRFQIYDDATVQELINQVGAERIPKKKT